MKKALLLLTVLLVCITGCALAAESTYTGTVAPFTVNAAGEHTLILNGVTIKATNTPAIDLKAPATKVTIILKNGTINTLTAGYVIDRFGDESGFAGLCYNGVDLVIRCESAGKGHTCTDSCGKLIVNGAERAGAIGGNDNRSDIVAGPVTFNGNLTIEGGNITANGKYEGAGIGGGSRGPMTGNITITGGNVTATGGLNGPGIGSSTQSDPSGIIRITGGTVVATGGCYAAGIGSANKNLTGTIIIEGGHVTATSTEKDYATGAGIGTGNIGNMLGEIIITGGTVIAKGARQAAGIGSYSDLIGNITITGGDVTAVGGSMGAGIGSGIFADVTGNISISNSTVNATGRGESPGIGSSYYGDMTGTITITNSAVTVTGKAAAGIGAGCEGNLPGDIIITNSTIDATGGDYAAGIGTSWGGTMTGSITITGSDVTAAGGIYGAGIGMGFGRDGMTGGSITITDTLVNATGGPQAPGIGAGTHMYGTITLSGVSGTITGGQFASGIGCMENYEFNGSITLIDPNFTVTGGAGKQNNQTVYAPSIGEGVSGTIGPDASAIVKIPTDETWIYAGIDQNNAELVEGSPFSGLIDLMDVLNGQPYVRFEHIVSEVPVEASAHLPQTGDPMNPALLCLLLAGAAGVAVLAGKMRVSTRCTL